MQSIETMLDDEFLCAVLLFLSLFQYIFSMETISESCSTLQLIFIYFQMIFQFLDSSLFGLLCPFSLPSISSSSSQTDDTVDKLEKKVLLNFYVAQKKMCIPEFFSNLFTCSRTSHLSNSRHPGPSKKNSTNTSFKNRKMLLSVSHLHP